MVINSIVPLIDLTDAQYDRLIANDVSGWMELRHQECALDEVCKKLGTFQYEYIDKDLNKAIELISGDGQRDGLPKIFTIVNECYEASLRLFTEAYEDLSDEYVDIFPNSTHFHSNNNNKAYNGMDFGSLRTNAREWFKKDYAFYDAAVSQSKVYFTTSNIDRSHFADCMYWNDDDEDLMNTNEEVQEIYISSAKIPVSIDSLVL
jgi:hypothetical protein